MKKLLTSLTLIAFAGILFSSCSNSSKMSFTKRHYRSGYFVDHIGKTHTVQGVAGLPIKPVQGISCTTEPETKIAPNTPIFTTPQKSTAAENRNTNSRAANKNISTINSILSGNINENPVPENKQITLESNSVSQGSSERDALSLLWIVIVIILIIWLIGIVIGGFGLGGGLINLLLLIALILLILWLLRVW
jgi:hypothetical protein